MTIFIDYYLILEIPFNTSNADIRKAYIKQASIWHPDKNNTHNAHEKMLLINEAYLVLHDTETRTRYDKEYIRYKEINNEKYENAMLYQQDGADNFKCENYIEDDILKEWIAKAKVKASELNELSFEDIMGMCSSAMSGCLKGILKTIITLFIINIIVLIYLYLRYVFFPLG